MAHSTAPLSAVDRFVDTADGPVRYMQAGSGRDVVLLHGAITSLEDMALGPFDTLSAAYRVTAFDRPGHGRTPRSRLAGAPERQARHIRGAVRSLGLKDPIIVGQSFGGALTLDYALLFPEEIRGAVVISPIAFPEFRLEHLLFGPRAMVGLGDVIAFGPGPAMDALLLPILWRAMFAPQPMPERFRDHYPFAMAGGPSQMLAVGEEAVLALPDLTTASGQLWRCKTPIQVLAGEADVVASPYRHARRLAAILPRAELTMLAGQGHMLHHFAQDQVLEAVRRLDGA
jgi:pimeloyl-ACP methyl ester carboxylesterase